MSLVTTRLTVSQWQNVELTSKRPADERGSNVANADRSPDSEIWENGSYGSHLN
jgi:hypothetical protein